MSRETLAVGIATRASVGRLRPLRGTPGRRRMAGVSLVELMVSLVVGMIASLAIYQSFMVFNKQKQTSVAGADATTNGQLAQFMLQRELRNAGAGAAASQCQGGTVRYWNGAATATFNGWPVTVNAAGDQLDVLYSTGAGGSVPRFLQQDMSTSGGALNIDQGMGFAAGDLVLLSQAGQPCSLIQASAAAAQTATANTTVPAGVQWSVAHGVGGSWPYNPPVATNIFPAGGYTTGAQVTNFGTMGISRFTVVGDALTLTDVRTGASSALVKGVVALRAQLGRDTDGDDAPNAWDTTAPTGARDVTAVRVAVLVQDGEKQSTQVSPDSITLLNANDVTPTAAAHANVSLTSEQRYYRYKVYQTIVPLRNVLWTN